MNSVSNVSSCVIRLGQFLSRLEEKCKNKQVEVQTFLSQRHLQTKKKQRGRGAREKRTYIPCTRHLRETSTNEDDGSRSETDDVTECNEKAASCFVSTGTETIQWPFIGSSSLSLESQSQPLYT